MIVCVCVFLRFVLVFSRRHNGMCVCVRAGVCVRARVWRNVTERAYGHTYTWARAHASDHIHYWCAKTANDRPQKTVSSVSRRWTDVADGWMDEWPAGWGGWVWGGEGGLGRIDRSATFYLESSVHARVHIAYYNDAKLHWKCAHARDRLSWLARLTIAPSRRPDDPRRSNMTIQSNRISYTASASADRNRRQHPTHD